MTHLVAVLLLALSSPAHAGAVGFRNGGSGRYDGTTLPASLQPADALWSTELPAWSNGSPVVLSDRVCAVAEPTTTLCVSSATGKLLWRADTTVGDTLPPDQQAAWKRDQQAAVARAAEAERLQAEYSQLRRDVRRAPGDAALATKLEDTGIRLARLRQQVTEEAPRYFTPPDRDVVGYTTHSPISDGTRVYALFGNGVVTAFTPDGRRVWARWLGPAPARMRGHYLGTAASPILVDGLLVVPHDELTALDPATGEVRWRSVPYVDYGTPAATKVGGTTVIATPDGKLVRARDGVLLQEGLSAPWYVGPLAVGDTIYWVGGQTSPTQVQAPPKAEAWKLREVSPGQVRAERLWSTQVVGAERFYTPPVAVGDALYALDTKSKLFRIDRATGAVRVHLELFLDVVYASPVIVGDRLLLVGEQGHVVAYDLPSPSKVVAEAFLEDVRSTPVAVGDRLYLRTLEHLWCFGRKP
jgi:outer membrane protein assembly factor BamB